MIEHREFAVQPVGDSAIVVRFEDRIDPLVNARAMRLPPARVRHVSFGKIVRSAAGVWAGLHDQATFDP